MSIGGYLALELNKNESEIHSNAIKLNIARRALEYLLLVNKYEKVYLPYFTCDAILQPIKELKLAYEFYSINENFEIKLNLNGIKSNEVLLYTNYFALKNEYIKKISQECKNLIIDNAQAFFCKPILNIDTFYSVRKFIGVSDGAYLYSKKLIEINLVEDNSNERFNHLLKRIDENAENGYTWFQKNEILLNSLELKTMSKLTSKILNSINFDMISIARKENFKYLHQNLKEINLLKIELDENLVPLVYPFYSKNIKLRDILLKHKIYTAMYWPNVLNWVANNTVEYEYTTKLVHLPIDQNISKKDLDTIIELIYNEHNRK